jgi:predicted AAA+ superfamily ATPase
MRGPLIETFIVSDLLKQQYNLEMLPSLYFWRDHAGNEIDCLIDEGKKIIALEVKAGRTTSQRFFEGIEHWQSLVKNKSTASFVVFAGSKQQTRGYANLVSWQNMSTIDHEIFGS